MSASRAFVGLGSNLADPVGQVLAALDALGRLAEVERISASSLYAGPPMGPPSQPDYVNAVAELGVRGEPHTLLQALQRIEARHGRRRDGERWGPRTLDLDLLLFGGCVLDTPQLVLPHPGIAERAFVLVPLCEIDASVEVPGLGRVDRLLQALPGTGLRRLPPATDAAPVAF